MPVGFKCSSDGFVQVYTAGTALTTKDGEQRAGYSVYFGLNHSQ
jgi:hypothetical protein